MKILDAVSPLLRWTTAVVGAVVLFAVSAGVVHAQSVTFGASVTNADGTLSTQLSWSAPGASSCIGSGHPAWNGDKAAVGTQDLPAITMSGTYALMLTCTFPGDTSAHLSWKAPTQNTDGSMLTNLAGFNVYRGSSAANLSKVAELGAGETSYTFDGLSVGTHYFSVSALNANSAESALAAPVSKTITGDVTESASVSLTVNPVPAEPANLAVE